MRVPSSPEDRERGTGWVGSRRGLAVLAGGAQKEYRDPRSGQPPHPPHPPAAGLQTAAGPVEHKPLASAWGAGAEGAGLT